MFGRTKAGQYSVEVFAVDDAMVLTVHDLEITFMNADVVRTALEEELVEKVDCGVQHVIVDLAGVTSVDHAGVSALIDLNQVATAKGAQLILCSLNAVMSGPNLSRVKDAITVVASRAKALKDCSA